MSVGAVSTSPPQGLPTDRPPTPEEVQANHAAFQSSLVDTYTTAAQSANANQSGASNGTGAPPTQVLGDDPNDAFKAKIVDTYINASSTPNPFGTPPTTPSLGTLQDNAPLQQTPEPLSSSGVGINVSAST